MYAKINEEQLIHEEIKRMQINFLYVFLYKKNIRKNAAILTKFLKASMGDTYKGRKVKISETKTRRLLK